MMDNLLHTVPLLWFYKIDNKCIAFFKKNPDENIQGSLLHLSALTQLQEESSFITQEKCLNYWSALCGADPTPK